MLDKIDSCNMSARSAGSKETTDHSDHMTEFADLTFLTRPIPRSHSETISSSWFSTADSGPAKAKPMHFRTWQWDVAKLVICYAPGSTGQ